MTRKATAMDCDLRYGERREPSAEPTHDVVAVDSDGNAVYDTDAVHSYEEAVEQRDLLTQLLGTERSHARDDVAGFLIQER